MAVTIGYDGLNMSGRDGIAVYSRALIREATNLPSRFEFNILCRKRQVEALMQLPYKPTDKLVISPLLRHHLALGGLGKPLVKYMNQRVWLKRSTEMDLVHITGHHHIIGVSCPFVVTVHDLFPLSEDAGLLKRETKSVMRTFDWQIENAVRVISPSQWVANSIVERYPAAASKVHVVPLSSSFAIYRKNEVELAAMTAEPKTVLWYGRADARKNLVRTVEAFLALPESVRARCKFVILLGGYGPIRRQFLEQHRMLLASPSVEIRGSVSDEELLILLRNANLLAFPSLAEGFGLPILEAMSQGCPVITANTTATQEVADDAAILVDPTSVNDVSNAMYSMLTNRDLVGEYVIRGYRRAEQYSWRKTAEATLEVYRLALAQRAGTLSEQ